MNAFAMREVDAFELAERRREVIAQQIKDCIVGKTQYVNIAWSLQSIVQRKSRIGIIECLARELSEAFEEDYAQPLLNALDDADLREKLLDERERIIGDWADTTHNCMTNQELEALPC